MSYTKHQQAADIAADLLRLHYEDCDNLVNSLDNSINFYAKMEVINKLCQDYENDKFDHRIMTHYYKVTPRRLEEARLTMLYTLLPKLSEIDMINIKSAYGMRKGQKIIEDIENTFISNIYTLYPDLPKRETLMRVINNIHAKDMIFGIHVEYRDNKAYLRTLISALNRNWFYDKMQLETKGRWNYVDGDLNIEVIELFIRRLMSFTL